MKPINEHKSEPRAQTAGGLFYLTYRVCTSRCLHGCVAKIADLFSVYIIKAMHLALLRGCVAKIADLFSMIAD
jgi:hypothetical protein